MKFSSYLVFAALYVGVVYPAFAYFLWNGPLARLGVQDYAGSLGVHAIGGMMLHAEPDVMRSQVIIQHSAKLYIVVDDQNAFHGYRPLSSSIFNPYFRYRSYDRLDC